jgi:hypothetical protein
VPAKGPALNTPELFNGARLAEAGFAGTTDNFIRLTIASGRPRMSEWARAQSFIDPMPTWGETYGGPLRNDQVDALTAYVLNWGLAFGDGSAPTAVPVDGVGTDITQALPAGDAASGEALATAQACVACHASARARRCASSRPTTRARPRHPSSTCSNRSCSPMPTSCPITRPM